jgi:hypothetical protein
MVDLFFLTKKKSTTAISSYKQVQFELFRTLIQMVNHYKIFL